MAGRANIVSKVPPSPEIRGLTGLPKDVPGPPPIRTPMYPETKSPLDWHWAKWFDDLNQSGVTGLIGYTGPPGPAGADGDPGAPGSQGPRGYTGPEGDQGATGANRNYIDGGSASSVYTSIQTINGGGA